MGKARSVALRHELSDMLQGLVYQRFRGDINRLFLHYSGGAAVLSRAEMGRMLMDADVQGGTINYGKAGSHTSYSTGTLVRHKYVLPRSKTLSTGELIEEIVDAVAGKWSSITVSSFMNAWRS